MSFFLFLCNVETISSPPCLSRPNKPNPASSSSRNRKVPPPPPAPAPARRSRCSTCAAGSLPSRHGGTAAGSPCGRPRPSPLRPTTDDGALPAGRKPGALPLPGVRRQLGRGRCPGALRGRHVGGRTCAGAPPTRPDILRGPGRPDGIGRLARPRKWIGLSAAWSLSPWQIRIVGTHATS